MPSRKCGEGPAACQAVPPEARISVSPGRGAVNHAPPEAGARSLEDRNRTMQRTQEGPRPGGNTQGCPGLSGALMRPVALPYRNGAARMPGEKCTCRPG